MEIIKKYFPELASDPVQGKQLEQLDTLYRKWNQKINVISRKDMDGLYEKHVLHSLAIYGYYKFPEESKILDIGTGGGFPAIPLAIAFPHSKFHAVDSIGKKITVVKEVSSAIGLSNLNATQSRVEQIREPYDYIVSRAVAPLAELVQWTHRILKREGKGAYPGKYLLLKGGDLTQEIEDFHTLFPAWEVKEFPLSMQFSEEFFETKKILEVSPVGKLKSV